MFTSVTLPMWLLVLILLFAAVTFATHFLNPTVRWFFRNRAERVVARLNQRLDVPIQPFKLAARHDTILRLIYDPEVTRAVAEHAHATGLREDAAFAVAKRYAREIVPSFSASAYFGFAIRAARWLSNSLFHVRVEEGRDDLLHGIDPEATIVFVMNHRSNMDYVLVTWLSGTRSALSYAVGEWARVWPLSPLIRAMGAYFIRRTARTPLYRRVLARYVQQSIGAGVTQGIFPEGGLSLDGAMGPAKLGLLGYIVEGATRDVVFVPVALNYDQVLEDRILVEAGQQGVRRFRGSLFSNGMFILRWLGRRITGQSHRFGHAAVAFGQPVALRDVPGDTPKARTTALADALMAELRRAVPVLPVPMACLALQGAVGAMARGDLLARMEAMAGQVPGVMCLTGSHGALNLMLSRGMVREKDGMIRVQPGQEPLVAFYAATIVHHFGGDAAVQEVAREFATPET